MSRRRRRRRRRRYGRYCLLLYEPRTFEFLTCVCPSQFIMIPSVWLPVLHQVDLKRLSEDMATEAKQIKQIADRIQRLKAELSR